MIDPKIETALAARNPEAKVCSRGGIEDTAMLTSKRFPNDLFKGKKDRAVLVVTEFIAEKIQEVENVYKEYTVEILEGEFRINLLSSSMKEINASWFVFKAHVGIVGRVRRKRANQDGVLFGCDEEMVPTACVHGLFSLRLRRSVERKYRTSCEDTCRLMPLSSKSYRVSCMSFRRKDSFARATSLGVRHFRFVKKKDGSHRMFSDYRELNRVTIKNSCICGLMDRVNRPMPDRSVIVFIGESSGGDNEWNIPNMRNSKFREGFSSERLADIYLREAVVRHRLGYVLAVSRVSYNNGFLSSIEGPLYKMLYGKKCRILICWGEVGQSVLGSLEVVQKTTENIQRIKDVGRQLRKGVIRFCKRGKLGPRYIGLFTVLARIGKVAYRLELPEVLGQIHNTFHVCQLRKCLADETAHVSLDDIQVDESLNYVERPVAVLE
ncbi:hypothetical protein OSB04_031930 [Centaurea solstitialis]|uniref:Tf2-1-like SH3-like domain-containing protein n=1 Tax=Centaurea solstitialis TaxID=347529 RepID=A0AA38VUV0_9ASTR|nr:hypothetical protein OSB04_031930 [Centaurea solstitialis]